MWPGGNENPPCQRLPARLRTTRPGDPVNLEVDLVARYVERLLGARAAVDAAGGEGAQA